MKLALVGSRDYDNYTEFKTVIAKTLEKQDKEITDVKLVISGGAKGADTLAEKWTKEYKIATTIFIPNWKAFGKAAGPMRNTDIVNECTHMIAFPSVNGKGTQDSIGKAKENDKVIEVFEYDKPKKSTLEKFFNSV